MEWLTVTNILLLLILIAIVHQGKEIRAEQDAIFRELNFISNTLNKKIANILNKKS
jgi:hypothetical protein